MGGDLRHEVQVRVGVKPSSLSLPSWCVWAGVAAHILAKTGLSLVLRERQGIVG